MFRIILVIIIVISVPSAAMGADAADQNFKEKLSESIQKTEKSIKIIRQQIIESQNAPFLPDLYVQLADLLSQKALTLYYIQMERDGKIDMAAPKPIQESQPVVQATKEAIDVYQLVLHDFPTYGKRSEVAYKLALSLKSIDEVPKFIAVASRLIKDFPGSEDAMRASLLLGRHFLDNHEWDESYQLLKGIAESKYPYEKNLARYWIGLIDLGKEKYGDALHQFETVVSDPELKEQENPYDVVKRASHSKTDLKREALIDSIRAYTYVYDKNADPVGYYSKLCPTETYFQEVMEKLALRYVFLKKYNDAVRLLRTTSERTADPQKVVNVYHQVLMSIPLQQRITIPVEEMRFVLQKYNVWMSYYETSNRALSDSYWFFEKQIRDLGTRNHDLAKTERDIARRRHLLESARDYYLLYLGFFDHTSNTVKMATDLADVYYLMGDYYESGDYYLKIFQGEFGPTPTKKAVIENAILALEKDRSEAFYDKVRAKGLLIKAVTSYQAMVPSLKHDARLGLLLLKTEYEQGFLPETLDALYEFAKAHRNARQAMDASDLILDYFNTRNDFSGLEFWVDKIRSLRLPDSAYNAKLGRMKIQAKAKVVQEKVKSVAGYDEFAQGRSYLTAALQSNNAELQSVALQEALAKSKREHDIQTFLEAATIFAKKETNPQKKASILRSVAQENMKIGRFYAGFAQLRRIAGDGGLDAKSRVDALEDATGTALMLHDIGAVDEAMRDPLFGRVSSSVQTRVREQISDALDSPVDLSSGIVPGLFRMGLSDDALLSLYKARYKLGSASRSRVATEVRARCGSESRQPVCLWSGFEQLEADRYRALQLLRTAPADLKSLEGVASQFMGVISKYQALENGADPHLATAISLRGRELYQAFAAYLNRVAAANPDLRNDLVQKSRESLASAQVYQQKCSLLVQKAPAANPAMKFCAQAQASPTFDQLLAWSPGFAASPSRSDPSSGDIDSLQKAVFSGGNDPEPLLKLSSTLYQQKRYYHAAALATYGIGVYKDREADFRAVAGCSVLRLGFLAEAGYHLRSASDYLNLKNECWRTLQGARMQ